MTIRSLMCAAVLLGCSSAEDLGEKPVPGSGASSSSSSSASAGGSGGAGGQGVAGEGGAGGVQEGAGGLGGAGGSAGAGGAPGGQGGGEACPDAPQCVPTETGCNASQLPSCVPSCPEGTVAWDCEHGWRCWGFGGPLVPLDCDEPCAGLALWVDGFGWSCVS